MTKIYVEYDWGWTKKEFLAYKFSFFFNLLLCAKNEQIKIRK